MSECRDCEVTECLVKESEGGSLCADTLSADSPATQTREEHSRPTSCESVDMGNITPAQGTSTLTEPTSGGTPSGLINHDQPADPAKRKVPLDSAQNSGNTEEPNTDENQIQLEDDRTVNGIVENGLANGLAEDCTTDVEVSEKNMVEDIPVLKKQEQTAGDISGDLKPDTSAQEDVTSSAKARSTEEHANMIEESEIKSSPQEGSSVNRQLSRVRRSARSRSSSRDRSGSRRSSRQSSQESDVTSAQVPKKEEKVLMNGFCSNHMERSDLKSVDFHDSESELSECSKPDQSIPSSAPASQNTASRGTSPVNECAPANQDTTRDTSPVTGCAPANQNTANGDTPPVSGCVPANQNTASDTSPVSGCASPVSPTSVSRCPSPEEDVNDDNHDRGTRTEGSTENIAEGSQISKAAVSNMYAESTILQQDLPANMSADLDLDLQLSRGTPDAPTQNTSKPPAKAKRLALGSSKGDKKEKKTRRNSARKTISQKSVVDEPSEVQSAAGAARNSIPQQKVGDTLKGSGNAKVKGVFSETKKVASPGTKPKKVVSPSSEGKAPGSKASRGPRAKMSLSPNRLSTITIEDYFKPLAPDKSPTKTARKTLAYSPSKAKNMKKNEEKESSEASKSSSRKLPPKATGTGENTISRDAASKALSALQTESSPNKQVSENSDVENNPGLIRNKSSAKGVKMPKAKKSFPKPKQSSPTEILEKFTKSASPKTSIATPSDQMSTSTLSTSSASPMTFKLKELESAFGIKRKLIGKLDAKTLDQLVLDRTQEVNKEPKRRRSRSKRSVDALVPVKMESEQDIPQDVQQSSGGSQTGGSQTGGSQTVGSLTGGSQTIGSQTIGSQTVGSLTGGSQTESAQGLDLSGAGVAQADVNFASLLTSQKILKKRSRRRMGRYNLPGQKRRKKPAASRNSSKNMTAASNAVQTGNSQTGRSQDQLTSHTEQSPGLKLKICASSQSGHFTVQAATASASHTPGSVDHTPGSVDHTPGSVDHTPGSVDHTPGSVDHTLGSVDNTLGSVDNTPDSVDNTPGSEDNTPGSEDNTPGSVEKVPADTKPDSCPGIKEEQDDAADAPVQASISESILKPQTTTRRSRIRRKTSKRKSRWALGTIPKQRRAKQPRPSKVICESPVPTTDMAASPDPAEQKTSAKSPQLKELWERDSDPEVDAAGLKCRKKRKWTANGDDESDVSVATSKSDPDVTKNSKQGSKRQKPVEFENDNIPQLSLATTALPIVTRASVVNSQPPKITPQKVPSHPDQLISLTKCPPQLSPMKITGVSLLKPSPKQSKVCLGTVPKDVKYRIEGAHGVDGGHTNSSGRQLEQSYKFHNTPNGVTYPVTPPSTPEHGSLCPSEQGSVSPETVEVKGADRAQDFTPVCCCKMKGLTFNKLMPSQKHPIYCQALDSVNGKVTGCCNKTSQSQMVRASRKVPFMAVCEVHRHRMRMHQCCPGCGQFCTEGEFLQCKTEKLEGSKKKTVLHHFHRQCQIYKGNKYYCPHCGQESKQYQVHLKLNGPPTSWTELRDPEALSPKRHQEDGVDLDEASLSQNSGRKRDSSDKASEVCEVDIKPEAANECSEAVSGENNSCSPGTVNSRLAAPCLTAGSRSLGRSARMCQAQQQTSQDEDELLTPAVAMEIPATNKLVSSKTLPLGPSRTELENAIMLLEGDRSKKLRPGNKNLFKACRIGDTEKVVLMLGDGADPNTRYEDEENQSALHAAATSGYHLLVHMLLQAGASPHAVDNRLRTPLMEASEQGHLQSIQILIKAGSVIDAKGSDGMSSIHLAAQSGKVDAVKYLLQTKRTGVNVRDDGGWTPLIWAAEYSHLDVVHYLLQMGADPNIRDNEGNTALHWAAYSGSVDIAEIFLNAGCDMETVNELGDRPLHIASRQDHYETVVLLLARGADSEARNNDNEAPISCCSDKDSPVWMALRVNQQLKGFSSRQLNRSERLLHRDISYGREQNPMPVVNQVDDENYPTDFLYVMENVETSPMNVNRLLSSLQACRCRDTCGSVFCECSVSSVRCWYEKDGRLIKDFSFSDPPLIFECNKACRCWATCANRVVQLGVTCRLQVFRTSGRGWGARTLLDIPKGSFVCEYIGELISDAEADSREDDSYLFDLDNKDADTFCIDARRYGNVSRFINHLCEPNLVPVKVFVEHQDLRFPRICFFASRDIKAYEELGFDYGEKFWIIKWKQFTCTCGSSKCRYSSETIHKTLEEYNRKQEEELDQEL